jgi:hypothetical protein
MIEGDWCAPIAFGGFSMRRTHWASVLLGGVLSLFPGNLPAARAAEPEKVKFDTVDFVEIQGRFYPSAKGKKAPCVLLLHKIGGNSHEGKWDALAEALQKKDIAVLSFDFRGHGDSTSVSPDFWKLPPNRGIRGFKASDPKKTISYKDFSKDYFPLLVNDISAAKLFLDRRNDGNDCNSANLVVIGAEDGANLGALWLATEMARHRVIPGFKRELQSRPEGKDVFCAIWLTMTPVVGPKPGVSTGIQHVFKEFTKDKKVPMAFLYGEKDANAKNLAKSCVNTMKGSEDDAKYPVAARAVKSSATLSGINLVNKDLDTESMILGFLQNLLDKKTLDEHEDRKVEDKAYVWKTPTTGHWLPAKDPSEKLLKFLEPFKVLK